MFKSLNNSYIQMHLAVFLWGFTGIFGVLIDLKEGPLVWYRMIMTSIFMLVFILFTKHLKFPDAKNFIRISLVGCIITLHWLFFYAAIQYSNISITLSCLASVALFTAILEPLFAGKKIDPFEFFFGLMAIGGIYLIFHFQELFATGIILSLISAFLGALFTVLNKRLVIHYPAENLLFFELSTGSVFLTFLLPLYCDIFPETHLIPSVPDVFYLIVLSLFCTALPFTLSLIALKKISAFTLNLTVNLEPVYSILLAILFFDEGKVLSAGFYAGTGVLLLSVFLHTLHAKKTRQQKPIRFNPE